MPYTNIQWIKLEKRLLNDHRFFLMSEKAQLYYVKVLLLCALTVNRVPRKYEVLRQLLRTECTESELNKIFDEIKNNFPKLLFHKDYYYIKGFKENHNYIAKKEFLGTSEGNPKDVVDKTRLDKIRKEYIKIKGWDISSFTSDDFGRTAKAIKTLITKASSDEQVGQALVWASRQKWCDWTLETVIKKWQDFLKDANNPLKKWEKDGN